MDRRAFLATSSVTLATTSLVYPIDKKPWSVAVIGHTGRGNYGHGLDTVWLHLPETEIVAVADADANGLAKAKSRLKIENGFSDYRKMLNTIRPQIVAICPRQPDQHREMCLAAVESGAKGIFIEKPFCRTPAEADEIIAACRKKNVKLAVAHRNRYHPTLKAIDQLISSGGLGKVLEIRGRGKGDHRGGAEDLWVLGSHVLNLINYLGGNPISCSAILRQNGKRVTKADVKQGNEALGLLAGNEVHARYEMQRGMIAYFDSIANDGTKNAGFGLQIIGSEGIIDMSCDVQTLACLVPGNPFRPTSKPRPWIPISSVGVGKPEPLKNLSETIGHQVGLVRDLIEAIRNNREPLCSMYEGAMTVEMICAVFASHQQNSAAVTFPLKERGNALAKL